MHLVQTPAPSLAAMVPGAQADAAVAPLGHAEPAGHTEQSPAPVPSPCAMPPVELRKLPALQAIGALAPEGQNDPAGQSSHSVSVERDAFRLTNFPGVHLRMGTQPVERFPAWNFPGRQNVQFGTLMSVENVPGGKGE